MSESLGTIRFGKVEPDQPELGAELLEARNVVPYKKGYGHLNELAPYTNTIGNRCLGAYAVKDRNGNSFNFAGDVNKLYRLVNADWVDSSQAGDYDAQTTRWSMARYGQDVVATNFYNNPQYLTLGGIQFADLTTLFRARFCAAIRQFMVFANTDDSTDGRVPERVRWSAFDNIFDYVVDPTTQSDFQDLKSDGGANTGIVGGEYGIIFQEKSIWRMTYVGPPVIWQIDEVDVGIGCLASGSIVQHGSTYFLSEDGFRITRGDRSEQIGEEMIDRTVLADLDQSYIDRVTGTVDVETGVIYWAYPGAGNINGTPNKLVLYNPTLGLWSQGEEAIDMFFRGAVSFTSLEDVDNFYASVDDVPGSLDDKVWTGGTFEIAAFTPNLRAQMFTGQPRTGLIRTGEIEVTPGRQTFMAGIRPLICGGETRIRLAHRLEKRKAPVFTNWSLVNSSGFSPFRVSSRYFRAEIEITTSFNNALGLEPIGVASGAR